MRHDLQIRLYSYMERNRSSFIPESATKALLVLSCFALQFCTNQFSIGGSSKAPEPEPPVPPIEIKAQIKPVEEILQVDSFQATALQVEQDGRIDILFVVDNSGSMASIQNQISVYFEKFITEFSKRNVDFQIGIITTDNRSSYTNINGDSMPSFNKAGAGSLVHVPGRDRILKSNTIDLIGAFQANSKTGITGSGIESGILAARNALSSNMLGSWNTGFIRSNSKLALIVVTDEDEFIPLPAVLQSNVFNPEKGIFEALNENTATDSAVTVDDRVNAFVANLKQAKGWTTLKDFSMYLITNPNNRNNYSAISQRVKLQNATTELFDVYGDFSSNLTKIGTTLANVVNLPSIKLSEAPTQNASIEIELVTSTGTIKLASNEFEFNQYTLQVTIKRTLPDNLQSVNVTYFIAK